MFRRCTRVHLHVHASDEKNRLEPHHVLTETSSDHLRKAHIVMCGPDSLVHAARKGLKAAGVPSENVHFEMVWW